eukprot:g19191.t1
MCLVLPFNSRLIAKKISWGADESDISAIAYQTLNIFELSPPVRNIVFDWRQRVRLNGERVDWKRVGELVGGKRFRL